MEKNKFGPPLPQFGGGVLVPLPPKNFGCNARIPKNTF